jgi:hypothetical protein
MGNTRQRNYRPVRPINHCVVYTLQQTSCDGSFSLDVSSRDSIIEAKKLIEEKEGKLHILVNKYVLLAKLIDTALSSAFLVLGSRDLS